MKKIITIFLLSFGLILGFSNHVYAAGKAFETKCSKYMAVPVKANVFDVFNEAWIMKLISNSNQTLAHLKKVGTDHLKSDDRVKAASLVLAFRTLEYAQATKSTGAIPSYIYVFENIEVLYNDLIRTTNRQRLQIGDLAIWKSLTIDWKVKKISDALLNRTSSGLSHKVSLMYDHVQDIRESRGFMSAQSIDVFTQELIKRVLIDSQKNQTSIGFETLISGSSNFMTRSSVDSASKDILRVAKILDIPLSSSVSFNSDAEIDILYALDFYKKFYKFTDLNSVKRYIVSIATEVTEIVSVHRL